MRRWISGWVWGAMVAASACGQSIAPQPQPKMTLVEPPGPLLPLSDTLMAASPEHPVPDDSAEAQAILKEDGLTRSEAAVPLAAASSKPGVGGWVRVYEFGDATGAFSAFTYFRMAPNVVAGRSRTDSRSSGMERVYQMGTSVVRARLTLYPESADALLGKIDTGLPKVSGRRGLAPLLPTMLPPEAGGAKLDPASVRYALGPIAYKAMGGLLPPDVLGWDKSLEVATAGYTGKGGKGTLTLLMYPTPQISGDRGRAVEQAVNAQLATLGMVKMRRVGPLVGVTSGSLKAEQAEALVQALHLQEIVTFDQKQPLEFHAEVRKTATLLQQIAIFTGVLMIAAVVIAVFLGGARAGIRVLRGKSAASDPEFLTIDLRDGPKAHFAPKGEQSEGPGGPTS